MLGLVLEGGGARGAYEIGAVKAFFENGYRFDGVVGTSIGSINAAIIAQGDFEKAYEIWERISPEQLFPGDEELLRTINDKDIDFSDITKAIGQISDLLRRGGIDTSGVRRLLSEYIDEDKLRSSKTDFGLVTFSLSDRKTLELFKEDIPQGELVDYLLASSMLPVFKQEKLSGKYFADGGYTDVLPYNMLIDKGYDDLVVVRVFGAGVTRKLRKKSTKMELVIPSDKLPGMLDFSPEATGESIKMGYYDALRGIRGYRGRKYFIEAGSEEQYFEKLLAIDGKYLRAIGNILSLPHLPGKRLLFDGIIPVLADSLELPENYTYEEFFIAILESAALSKGIDRYAVMTFENLLKKTLSTPYTDREVKYTKISFPYRNPTKNTDVFRLPAYPFPTSYSYKAPDGESLGNAIELFLRGIS